MKPLLIATGNAGKLREYKTIFSDLPCQILGLDDVPPVPAVVEDAPDFEGNAIKKALFTADALRQWSNEQWGELWVLADDSGLVVPALGGDPGVRSARYAGEDATDDDNIDMLLKRMADISQRSAYFQCALVLVNGRTVLGAAEGRCPGTIIDTRQGDGGFGYDPVFSPSLSTESSPDFSKAHESRSMAELTAAEKNAISHRGAAAKQMRSIIEQLLREANA